MNAKPYHVIKLQNSVREYFRVGDDCDHADQEDMEEIRDEKNCNEFTIDVKEEFPGDQEEILLKTITEILKKS